MESARRTGCLGAITFSQDLSISTLSNDYPLYISELYLLCDWNRFEYLCTGSLMK